MNGLGVTMTSNEVKDVINELKKLGCKDLEMIENLQTLGLELSRACNLLPPGLYQHYKGGRYFIHHIGRHSEDMSMMVSYQSMESGEVWFRPFYMFLEHINIEEEDLGLRFKRIVGGS